MSVALQVAERLMGLRKTRAATVAVTDVYDCPFHNRHRGISPSDDYCTAAYIPTLEDTKEWTILWTRGKKVMGQVLMCPDRRDSSKTSGPMNEWPHPEECPIMTGKLKVALRQKKRKKK